MKIKILTSIFILLLFKSYGQDDYDRFETPIKATANSYAKVYKDASSFHDYNCKIQSLDSLSVLILGYKSERYYIKQGECLGFINNFNINKSPKIEEQLQLIFKKAIEKSKSERELKRYNDSIAEIEYKNTCQYETNEIDDFNGKLRKYTDFYQVGDVLSYLRIQLRNFGGTYSIVFDSAKDLGCASSYSHDKSFVQVKLENGDILKFYHFGETDCGSFRLQGRLTNTEYARLLKSPIDKVRLQGTSYYGDIEDIVYKEIFIDKLKCLKQ